MTQAETLQEQSIELTIGLTPQNRVREHTVDLVRNEASATVESTLDGENMPFFLSASSSFKGSAESVRSELERLDSLDPVVRANDTLTQIQSNDENLLERIKSANRLYNLRRLFANRVWGMVWGSVATASAIEAYHQAQPNKSPVLGIIIGAGAFGLALSQPIMKRAGYAYDSETRMVEDQSKKLGVISLLKSTVKQQTAPSEA